MVKVIEVKILTNYRLHVRFDDGAEGELNLSDRLFGPMFEPLRDPAYFALATIDEFGVIGWPNGADLDPDALHERLCVVQHTT